jgi:molecular chaperone HscB
VIHDGTTGGGEARLRCGECGTEAPAAATCPGCGRLMPFAPGSDHWAVLGLPRRLTLDRADLERRVHELARRFHPDYYRLRSPAEQAQSLENSAAVNTAYRTLRDPVGRAEYVLATEGLDGSAASPAKPPADLFEEIMEIQEARQELAAAPPAEASALVDRLRAARADLEGRRAATEAALPALFARWDAAQAEDQRLILGEMRDFLGRRAYLRTVLRDLEAALDDGDRAEERAER